MNRTSPFPQLPIVSCMKKGFCWYLADSSWEGWAQRANKQMLCDPAEQDDVEILRRRPRRLIFRLKSNPHLGPDRSVVVKGFPMPDLKNRLWRYGRYGPTEIRNLLEAAERSLPVPKVFGYGRLRRGLLVYDTMIMMEDLVPRQPIGLLLEKSAANRQGQMEILDRTVDLFLRFYRAGCNHIDMNRNSIWFGENPSDDRITDFQYARFVKNPTVNVLMQQAGTLARSCSDIVPDEISRDWVKQLLKAADIADEQHWLKVYDEFRTQRLSRAYRLAVK